MPNNKYATEYNIMTVYLELFKKWVGYRPIKVN